MMKSRGLFMLIQGQRPSIVPTSISTTLRCFANVGYRKHKEIAGEIKVNQLEGPQWHAALGDYQDRSSSSPNSKYFKGCHNEHWKEHSENYGPLFLEVVWQDKTVVCTDKDDIQQVLHRVDGRLEKGNAWVVDLFNSIMPNNTFTATMDNWPRHRSNIDWAYTQGIDSQYLFQVVAEEAEILRQNVQKAVDSGVVLDFQELFRNYSFDVLTRVAVGQSFGLQEKRTCGWAKKVLSVIKETEKLSTRYGIGFYRRIPGVVFMRRRRTIAVRKEMLKWLNERKTQDNSEAHDLMGRLLHFRATHPDKGLHDHDIVSECLLVLVKGVENCASMSIFASFLGAHNHKMLAVHQEAAKVLGRGALTSLSPSVLSRLPLCSALLYESMRLYPPVQALHRTVQQEMPIRHVRMFAQQTLTLGVARLLKDPMAWFKPDCFLPERWLGGGGGREAKKGSGSKQSRSPSSASGAGQSRAQQSCPHSSPSSQPDAAAASAGAGLRAAFERSSSKRAVSPSAKERVPSPEPDADPYYIPFGAGPRSCPGRSLAMMQAQLAVSVLARDFEWSYVGEELFRTKDIPQYPYDGPMCEVNLAVMPKDGMKMRCRAATDKTDRKRTRQADDDDDYIQI